MSRKRQQLAASGTLNPTPEKVQDHLFQSYAFFDPDDALQVKYEMLRRVDRDGRSVTQAAKDFGFSRRHFYACNTSLPRRASRGSYQKNAAPRARINSPLTSWTSSTRRVRKSPAPRRLNWLDGCTITTGAASIPGALKRP